MITLYHCMNARSFRVLWTLEELQLPYELKILPFPPRVHARDYLQINPLGTIPLMIDGDTRMTESAAICEYLSTRYGPSPLAVGPDEPCYGTFLNFLHFGEATLTFPQAIVLRYSRLEPPERRLPQAVEDYARWFLGRLRAVEAIVSRSDYVCADRFTAADISVGYAFLLSQFNGLSERLPDAVRSYWDRLQARDGFRRADAAQKSAAKAAGISENF
ncbi:MAG: glutathione S-transferase family protein [Methylobacteriaceae bacterium]|nr:glutathione S-transferase family protein [Methylobacteriaceae bacterium]MBV9394703.1 glutathione S-transferase family protein [Methylobacteriaceae bacterium]